MKNLFKQIPQLNLLIQRKDFEELISECGHECVVLTCRDVLDELRDKIKNGRITESEMQIYIDNIINIVRDKLHNIHRASPCGVINATGTILHTNLGRSPLSEWQLSGISNFKDSYCDLEYDFSTGNRGSRLDHVDGLLSQITGAQSNIVVNNNAAAVLLVLCSLGAGSEVIISRGELVEIGGKFRIPEVLAQSGCKLVEVGTTNKTRIDDYKAAISSNTAAIIKVHTSNFKVVGFTESTSIEQLSQLCKDRDIMLIEDLGSGLLVDLKEFGLPYEPTVQRSIKMGVDIVCYSADKLLGGPQAGIISGKSKLIDIIKSNQLMRALRIGKLELSVLRQTLLLYLDKQRTLSSVPVLEMITSPASKQLSKAERLFDILDQNTDIDYSKFLVIKDSESYIGGGSMPTFKLRSVATVMNIPEMSPDEICRQLRIEKPHVVARISNNEVILDMRCVFEQQLFELSQAIIRVLEANCV